MPLAAVSAGFFLLIFWMIPQIAADKEAASYPEAQEDAERQALGHAFLPFLNLVLYGGVSLAAYITSRVADPCRDINAVLVRVAPTRVIASPEARERYRRGVMRSLFLTKTLFALWILAYQVYQFRKMQGA